MNPKAGRSVRFFLRAIPVTVAATIAVATILYAASCFVNDPEGGLEILGALAVLAGAGLIALFIVLLVLAAGASLLTGFRPPRE